jgi:hypothetical protein
MPPILACVTGQAQRGITRSSRSFAVEAHVGRMAAGWPFARFAIGPPGLRVRLVFPCFAVRSADKAMITAISVRRSFVGVCCLRFDGSAGGLADVRVYLRVRARPVFDELRRCGYVVVDWRSGEELGRPPKRTWPWEARRRG